MSYNHRNGTAGVFGEFQDLTGQKVLFLSDDRSSIEIQIKAYYFDHPNELIYLCDARGLIYGIYIHKELAELSGQVSKERAKLVCAGLLLGMATVGSLLFSGPSIFLLAPLVVFFLYLMFVRVQILNEIQSAVLIGIFTILFYLLLHNVMTY